MQRQVGNSASQRVCRLPQKQRGGRTEEEKSTGSSVPINKRAQLSKKRGESLNFIDDDQLFFELFQKESGVLCERPKVFGTFQIEVPDRALGMISQHPGQRGFAHLTRTNEPNNGEKGQISEELIKQESW